ncbi:class I SAM-dependent methyltransferase [Deinococcus sp.]|uniref:class I SAM-dependent methyltransferase n=1 Tax=Deinococcus sp. TaxID=47478 RepID=UPI0028698666|nr:class I SAM-dependent methyltransferase [Deinococcus sp.]
MLAGWNTRAEALPEIMDDPHCDPIGLERTYRAFDTINAVIGGWRQVYTRDLRPLLIRPGGATLLDVGCGGGDVARHLARWAARDRLSLRITAIDADARAIQYAQALPTVPGVTYRQAMSGDLCAEAQRYDLVISNHLLHHLNAAEFTALLADTEALCTGLAVHGDIERHPLAYAAYRAVTPFLFPGSFIRIDGLRSIRRSYTHLELALIAPPGWMARRQFPFRNLLMWRATHA